MAKASSDPNEAPAAPRRFAFPDNVRRAFGPADVLGHSPMAIDQLSDAARAAMVAELYLWIGSSRRALAEVSEDAKHHSVQPWDGTTTGWYTLEVARAVVWAHHEVEKWAQRAARPKSKSSPGAMTSSTPPLQVWDKLMGKGLRWVLVPAAYWRWLQEEHKNFLPMIERSRRDILAKNTPPLRRWRAVQWTVAVYAELQRWNRQKSTTFNWELLLTAREVIHGVDIVGDPQEARGPGSRAFAEAVKQLAEYVGPYRPADFPRDSGPHPLPAPVAGYIGPWATGAKELASAFHDSERPSREIVREYEEIVRKALDVSCVFVRDAWKEAARYDWKSRAG